MTNSHGYSIPFLCCNGVWALFYPLRIPKQRQNLPELLTWPRVIWELINEIYSLSSSSQLIFEIVLILINDQAPATQFSKAVFTGIFYTHRSCNCCLGLWEQLVPSVGLVSGIGNQGWGKGHLDFGLAIGLWPLGGGRLSSVVTTRRERGREGRTAGVLYRPTTLVRCGAVEPEY